MRSRLGYLPALDGLRGIAVLLVLAFHAGLPGFQGGHLGVDLFFVLSGFLITALLVQEWEQSGTISLRRFYLRRVLRLTPAFYLLLSAYALWLLATHAPTQQWWSIGYAAAYVSNWVRAFGREDLMGPLGHTWSLAMEEQFYLTWPLLLLAMLRARLPRSWILGTALGGAALSTLWRLILFRQLQYAPHWDARLYNGFDSRADSLLLGCAVALLWCWNLIPMLLRNSRVTGAGLAVGAIAGTVLVSRVGYNHPYTYLAGLTVAALLSALCLLHLMGTPGKGLVRCLQAPALVWVGRLSYSLYLWHAPLFSMTKSAPVPWWLLQPARFAAAFALATLSYYLVERPFLRLKQRFQPAGGSGGEKASG